VRKFIFKKVAENLWKNYFKKVKNKKNLRKFSENYFCVFWNLKSRKKKIWKYFLKIFSKKIARKFLEKISSNLEDFQNYKIPEKNLKNLADAEKIAAQNLVAEILANAAEIENEIENF